MLAVACGRGVVISVMKGVVAGAGVLPLLNAFSGGRRPKLHLLTLLSMDQHSQSQGAGLPGWRTRSVHRSYYVTGGWYVPGPHSIPLLVVGRDPALVCRFCAFLCAWVRKWTVVASNDVVVV